MWNGNAREKLRSARVATAVSYAETTAEKVMPWLDAQAHGWQAAWLDANVREGWDADLLDRAMWCLDERPMEFVALVEELPPISRRRTSCSRVRRWTSGNIRERSAWPGRRAKAYRDAGNA